MKRTFTKLCFWCGKDAGQKEMSLEDCDITKDEFLALPDKINLNYTPCTECAKKRLIGYTVIEVSHMRIDNRPSLQKESYTAPTGRCLITSSIGFLKPLLPEKNLKAIEETKEVYVYQRDFDIIHMLCKATSNQVDGTNHELETKETLNNTLH
jgi:hypothetical protein